MAASAHLIREILKELGVYQSGQDLPPEDYRVVEDRLPFEVATLYRTNIYGLDDIENIPDEALVPLAQYIAGRFTQVFGIVGEERQGILQQQAAAETELRFLRTGSPTYSRQKIEFF